MELIFIETRSPPLFLARSPLLTLASWSCDWSIAMFGQRGVAQVAFSFLSVFCSSWWTNTNASRSQSAVPLSSWRRLSVCRPLSATFSQPGEDYRTESGLQGCLQDTSGNSSIHVRKQDVAAVNIMEAHFQTTPDHIRPHAQTLGVMFDGDLSFNRQVNSVVRSSFFQLRTISKMRHLLSPSDLQSPSCTTIIQAGLL